MEHAASALGQEGKCRLLIRRQPNPAEVLQFVSSGLEVGQQIVVLATPAWLKDLAAALTANQFRPDILLRNGRLIFLHAPDCFAKLTRRNDPLDRDSLRLNGSIVRWVSDWSWAYENGRSPAEILHYQRYIHSRIHQATALSLCTVHCSDMERAFVLKMLVQHRCAMRGFDQTV